MKKPNENIEELRQRQNEKDRPENYERTRRSTTNRLLGSQTRNKGSLISDVWKGTAADLAEQNTILVMPEGGWWKYRKHLNRGNQQARYALIVSLETENRELDIYTPIHAQIPVATKIVI